MLHGLRQTWVLFRHELWQLLWNPSTYLALCLCSLFSGFFFLQTLLQLAAAPADESPAFLFYSLFWIPVLLLVPMLTMRTLAEERRRGTLEVLLSSATGLRAIIWGKFGAVFVVYLLAWGITLLYPLVAGWALGRASLEAARFTGPELAGALCFLAMTGAFFVALGVALSSFTRSQLVASMLTFSVLFTLIVGLMALRATGFAGGRFGIDESGVLQVFHHLEDALRGIVDTRALVYYATATFLCLEVAVWRLRSIH